MALIGMSPKGIYLMDSPDVEGDTYRRPWTR